MKIGSLVYATDQGLGYLARAFYDHGVITDVAVVEHQSRVNHYNWYPDGIQLGIHPHLNTALQNFVKQMDVILFFETPFVWELIPYCRKAGVRTVLMPMYECMPKELPHKPDRIINPSLLDQQYYPEGEHIPIPVEVHWRRRCYATRFVHNAGNLGLKGRNGTIELLEAIRYIKNPIEFLIRAQDRKALMQAIERAGFKDDPRVKFQFGSIPQHELYNRGDVFVFPEKFNGLCLPLQEARGSGMLVIGTNRFPNTAWLPGWPLIPIMGYKKSSVSSRCNEFDEARIHPKDIADTIDLWYGKDISDYSVAGKEWAASMSWNTLKPRYIKALVE